MVSPRSVLALLVCLAFASSGCASYSAPAQRPDDWADDWKDRASRAAHGAAQGAKAVGGAMGTAFHGVTNGFEDPDGKAFGRYPKNYAETIRSHMIRFAGISADASFRFGKPEKAYLNKGILAGGGVDWQGYVVDVEVLEETFFESQRKPEEYVVRMRDGAVIEVIEAEYAGALRRVESGGPAAARK